jgi:hypothetical protein
MKQAEGKIVDFEGGILALFQPHQVGYLGTLCRRHKSSTEVHSFCCTRASWNILLLFHATRELVGARHGTARQSLLASR